MDYPTTRPVTGIQRKVGRAIGARYPLPMGSASVTVAQSLDVPCSQHAAAQGEPCWSLPNDARAVCSERMRRWGAAA